MTNTTGMANVLITLVLFLSSLTEHCCCTVYMPLLEKYLSMGNVIEPQGYVISIKQMTKIIFVSSFTKKKIIVIICYNCVNSISIYNYNCKSIVPLFCTFPVDNIKYL